MATHSSILAWKIPWMEEPGGVPLREAPCLRDSRGGMMIGENEAARVSGVQIINSCAHHD